MRKASEIRAAMQTLFATAATLQTQVHDIAVECAEHAQEHGDATLALELVKGMPQGQRTASLRAWFVKYTGIRFSIAGEEQKVSIKADAEWDIETGKATPYYSKPETVSRELTLEQIKKTALGLMKKVENAEKGKGAVKIKDGEDINQMKTLARRIGMVANGAGVTA